MAVIRVFGVQDFSLIDRFKRQDLYIEEYIGQISFIWDLHLYLSFKKYTLLLIEGTVSFIGRFGGYKSAVYKIVTGSSYNGQKGRKKSVG